MAEFIILSQAAWEQCTIVEAETTAELREVAKQGYRGTGRYAVCRWDNRREFNLGPGPVEATDPDPLVP